MEYRVKTIFNKEEIESCQRFSMDHFMWTCLQKPEAYGWMGYLKDQGLFVKLVCKEKDPKRVYHNFMDMVCEDSAMEVFLAFPEKGEALTNDVMYLNFEVNSNGAMYAAYGKGRKGRKPMPEKYLQVVDCKADRQEDSWTLTYLIPESYLKEEAGVEKLDSSRRHRSWSKCDEFLPQFTAPFANPQLRCFPLLTQLLLLIEWRSLRSVPQSDFRVNTKSACRTPRVNCCIEKCTKKEKSF